MQLVFKIDLCFTFVNRHPSKHPLYVSYKLSTRQETPEEPHHLLGNDYGTVPNRILKEKDFDEEILKRARSYAFIHWNCPREKSRIAVVDDEESCQGKQLKWECLESGRFASSNHQFPSSKENHQSSCRRCRCCSPLQCTAPCWFTLSADAKRIFIRENNY